ncbi:MAG: hypothetical protein GXY24_02380 [Bacteroidales bacterium]|nr:hypothetical protein [Bacteroidales bacterium]
MRYKAIKYFAICALSFLPFSAFAQQQDEAAELKQFREAIDKTVDDYTEQFGLEVWQTFYVDSILTHDYEAMRQELKDMQAAKMSNADAYTRVQDKWYEQMYNSIQKVLDEEQWAKYLKSGAAREKKARDKRAAKRK